MSKKITKAFGAATTTAKVQLLEDGALVEKEITVDGRKSERAMRAILRKQLSTQNFYISNLTSSDSDEQPSFYTMALDVFLSESEPCEPSKSYSREFVTATCKTSVYSVLYDGGSYTQNVSGTTTERKARKLISDALGTDNFMIMGCSVLEERRYMTREKFTQLATKRDA